MNEMTQIAPFTHQSECLGILRYVRQSAQKTALVIMASGLGKTITAAFHVRERFNINKKSRCLFLCHQNDILEQAQGEFLKVIGPNVRYGFFHGFEKTANAQVVFASFQTMRRNLRQFDPSEFDTIVVDETHHGMAETFLKVIQHFKPDFLLGITATPDRGDELDIREIYGKEVYNLPLIDAFARELLSPVEYKLMTDEISMKEVLETPNGQMSINRLNRTIFVPKRDTEIASIITRHMKEVENPKVIVFCSTVKHCEHMAKAIPGAVPIHSDLPRNERRTRLELFRQGVFQVAVTVDMFNEALDIPQANIIVFLRSTESKRIFFQQLGRGLRPHKDKSKVVILDFVGNCERISLVYELWQRIRKQRSGIDRLIGHGKVGGDGSDPIEPFSLNVDTIEFKERIVPLIEFIGRLKLGLYPSWKQASRAAVALGIKNSIEYPIKSKEDIRLPSTPHEKYEDFPGWGVFLDTDRGHRSSDETYDTWQLASVAAMKLGIDSLRSYRKLYKKDSRLPSTPTKRYSNFPGWDTFVGGNKYSFYSYDEFVIACRKLNVVSGKDYINRYKFDPRLPSDPRCAYKGFPGWPKFLGKA